jgi:hypothetical protein
LKKAGITSGPSGAEKCRSPWLWRYGIGRVVSGHEGKAEGIAAEVVLAAKDATSMRLIRLRLVLTETLVKNRV